MNEQLSIFDMMPPTSDIDDLTEDELVAEVTGIDVRYFRQTGNIV